MEQRTKDHLSSLFFAFLIWLPMLLFFEHETLMEMTALAVFYIFYKQFNQYPGGPPPRKGEQRYG